MQAETDCLRLLLHFARAAASRAFWIAGSSIPIRIAMMAMTTSSSISVNAHAARAVADHGGSSRRQSERAKVRAGERSFSHG